MRRRKDVAKDKKRLVTDEELIKLIEETLPELLRKRPELRIKIRAIFEEFVTRDELKAILEEIRADREVWIKEFREWMRKFDERLAGVEKEVSLVKERVTAVEERVTVVENRLTDVENRVTVVEERLTRLEEIVKELAEAQKNTELRLNELAEAQRRTELRLNELAEAQKRTELRLNELAEAQKKTELRLNELAEAQKQTELRLNELAEAQKQTELRLNELAEAQKRTEEEVKKLVEGLRVTRMELGGLEMTMGYAFENEAFRMLPPLLHRKYGIEVTERFVRVEIEGREINILGMGRRDGVEVLIVGESKLRLDHRRENFSWVLEELDKKVEAVRKKYGEKEVVKIIVTHFATSGALEEAGKRGIIVIQSFEW